MLPKIANHVYVYVYIYMIYIYICTQIIITASQNLIVNTG